MNEKQEVHRSFVFQVSDIVRLVRQNFSQEDGVDITRSQARVLISVWRNPGISQQALAGRLEIATMSVCRLVDALEGKGMLERRTDDADRRVRRLFVTEKTEPFIEKVLARIEAISDDFLAPLSTGERQTLENLLGRILSHASSKRTGTDQ
ncbi:MarR family winged helix-turn-helix transcriptional regulator [Kordiimonas marina]|uniref:MarR family winged helix-turn-helix transcriptional regulator n=1 Tax=Kordiimonas marina TaxID=2872312 RepID=UPI001FF5E378|nr:MarR family transcriptional regulator [Kordiimonas marina]MCJ9427891.1 MarR family transcriptional regulator [Kordiimonas marina]